jgi:hypothetical protein
MTFLNGKFSVYKLDDSNAEHQKALFTLKACAAAQRIWRRPTTTDQAVLWALWEKERDKKYAELEAEPGREGESEAVANEEQEPGQEPEQGQELESQHAQD